MHLTFGSKNLIYEMLGAFYPFRLFLLCGLWWLFWKTPIYYVSVQTTPQIYIPKRQMVLSTNASVRIPCFSINEPYNSFQYEWYENGAKIQWHTHNRFVESLLPAGTQLFAKRISQSTNFTCRVANMVGAVNLTTRVFVAKGIQTIGMGFCDKK